VLGFHKLTTLGSLGRKRRGEIGTVLIEDFAENESAEAPSKQLHFDGYQVMGGNLEKPDYWTLVQLNPNLCGPYHFFWKLKSRRHLGI
jgi:hypothetical protein